MTLTSRHYQIIDLMQAGLSRIQIAEQLEVSKRTIDAHLREVYIRLGVSSREDCLERVRETVDEHS